MRVAPAVVVAALFVAACSTQSGSSRPAARGTGGGTTAGTVLYIGGAEPLIGTDGLIHDALKARKVEVEDVNYLTATAAMAEGRSLVILSYSMQSSAFIAKATAMADLKVPIIVLEHNLLPVLGMTDAAGHGPDQGTSAITIVSDDATLTGGLPMGDVTVYTPLGKEVFWGAPGPGAIKVATTKGKPSHYSYFAYPPGAMMVGGKVAPGKRMLFFVASHAPPPVADQFLNVDGLKLLGAALDWCLE